MGACVVTPVFEVDLVLGLPGLEPNGAIHHFVSPLIFIHVCHFSHSPHCDRAS